MAKKYFLDLTETDLINISLLMQRGVDAAPLGPEKENAMRLFISFRDFAAKSAVDNQNKSADSSDQT